MNIGDPEYYGSEGVRAWQWIVTIIVIIILIVVGIIVFGGEKPQGQLDEGNNHSNDTVQYEVRAGGRVYTTSDLHRNGNNCINFDGMTVCGDYSYKEIQ